MDLDLRSIQQARSLLSEATAAFEIFHTFDQVSVDRIVSAMIKAGIASAEPLAELAHKKQDSDGLKARLSKIFLLLGGSEKGYRE